MSEHREFWRLLSLVLLLGVVPVTLASWGMPISARGIAWIVSLGVTAVALALASRRSLRVAAVGALVWLSVVVATIAWPDHATFLHAIELPSGDPPSGLSATFSERDASLVGIQVMRALGNVSERELDGFVEPLASVYDEIEASDGAITRTPFARTFLDGEDRDRFDVLYHREGDGEHWVLFLHGFGGSFASYCWVVARAAAEQGWSTACPATSISGRWEQGDGPTIVGHTLRWMRTRGASTVVLAGLSNGGMGASLIAPMFERELAGLVLISGVSSLARPTSLPTLIWHGALDERVSPEPAREYAAEAPNAEYVEVNGDHFALIEQRADFTRALGAFLARITTLTPR